VSVEPIATLLADVGDRLTPTERRLAELVLADPAAVAFGTVVEVGARVDASGPSVVRFAGKLGFDGYPGLQDRVRAEVIAQLARPVDRVRAADGPATSRAREVAARAVDAVAAVDDDRLADAARRLAGARTVWLVSGEASGAAAHVLAAGLRLLRPGVVHVEGEGIATAAADATDDDVVVVIDFPRYRRDVSAAAAAFTAVGTHVVAVTDGPLSPLVRHADDWFGVELPAVGPFDSAVAPVVLAELLLASVADELRATTPARLTRLEALLEHADVHLDG
jgi:DNA-binding MurR/RpiR family transcriptional regulator